MTRRFQSKRARLILGTILLVVLTLALLSPGIGDISLLRNDERQFTRIAFNLVRYGVFHDAHDLPAYQASGGSTRFMRQEPGYPLYLAAVFLTVPEIRTLSISCFLDDECESAIPLRRRVQVVEAVIAALTVAATFIAVHALVGSWWLSMAASLLCMFLFPRDVSGNMLIALFLLIHVILAAQMWCRPRIVTAVLSGVALGLLVLTEGLFQYWLVGVAAVLAAGCRRDVVRRRSLLPACAALLAAALGLSLPWMIRNQVELGRFGITGRGGEVLAIRAEYGRMTWSEVRGAFAYYLPVKGVLRAKAMRWLEPATYGYSRFTDNAPEGFHMRSRTYEGDVAARADLLAPGWRQPEDYRVGRWEIRNRVAQDFALKRAALSLIREDWLKHVVLTVAFAGRGNSFGCRDYSSAAENYGMGASLLLRHGCRLSRALSLLFLPAVGTLLFLGWKRWRFELVFLTLPIVGTFGILSLASHFIPRYSSPLVPVLAVCLALVMKDAWRWARARQWRPRR